MKLLKDIHSRVQPTALWAAPDCPCTLGRTIALDCLLLPRGFHPTPLGFILLPWAAPCCPGLYLTALGFWAAPYCPGLHCGTQEAEG